MGIFRNHDGDSSSSSSSSSSSNDTCAPKNPADYTAQPINGGWTLHHVMVVVSAILTAVTLVICFGLSIMHYLNFTVPHEQRQLVRAINVPIVFAAFALLAIGVYDASGYLIPISDLYECFALVALFYYIIVCVAPNEDTRDAYFSSIEVRGKDGGLVSGGSVAWFRKRWILVFQILPGRIITTIATWIIEGAMCHSSSHYETANTIIQVINGVQTAICIISIFAVYKQVKPDLQGRHVISKLLVLKVMVGIQVIQRIVFSVLINHTSVLNGSTYISRMDWHVGVPNFLTVCEAFLFSLAFIIPYSWRPYAQRDSAGRFSFFAAFLNVLNISDIFMGILVIFKSRSSQPRGQYAPTADYEQNTAYKMNNNYSPDEYPMETAYGGNYGRRS